MLVNLWKIGEHFTTRNHNEPGESEFIFFHFRWTTCYARRKRSLMLSVCFLFWHQESNWFMDNFIHLFITVSSSSAHLVSSFRIAFWVFYRRFASRNFSHVRGQFLSCWFPHRTHYKFNSISKSKIKTGLGIRASTKPVVGMPSCLTLLLFK
jgi:hypothetical protein